MGFLQSSPEPHKPGLYLSFIHSTSKHYHYQSQCLHVWRIIEQMRITERLNGDRQICLIHFPGLFFSCLVEPACLGAKETAEEMPALVWERGGHLTPSLR